MNKKQRIVLAGAVMLILSTLFMACSSSSVTEKKYPNANLLANSDDLTQAEVVILDTRSAEAYSQGHINGSISIPWQQFLDADSNLLATDQLEQDLSQMGLTRTLSMIIYDDTTASFGGAGRLFWMLEVLGCPSVRILNGGWDKWLADGNTPQITENTRPVSVFTAQVNTGITSDKEYIAARMDNSDFAIVDTREDEEFTGWQRYGEARGGHITGAVQIPYPWYFSKDKTVLPYENLKNLFESRGITQDKEVTAYCTIGIRSGFAYFLFRLLGYDRASNYDGSIRDWSESDPAAFPMEKLAQYSKLVYPTWVKQVIDYHAPGSTTPAPAGYDHDRDHKFMVVETQWGTLEWAEAYKNGHIPGAVHSNSDIYENDYPRWFLLPDDQLHAALADMGITEDTTVVVYSDSNIFAARLWWILTYAGVKDVRYLNGGYAAWINAGYEGETQVNNPVSTTAFTGTACPELLATVAEMVQIYDDTDTVVVADVRSAPEYKGKISGYSYVVQKGRIPNAVWAHDADDSSLEYTDSDGSLRSFPEIKSLWESAGISSGMTAGQFDRDVYFYCGSGYRSSLSFLHAYLMGFSNIKNFSDGWEGWSTEYTHDEDACADSLTPGWCQDPSGRPVATGEF
ncbi:SseA [Desulforapulum autotrophicum HRM2]|uniref:SseA n=1 Tax=Desulforapulum autotrophicum (strain ATCC 43914 / DSM 3382 / VKM B-1955 / HRM2) TaxID=177437 RepID=C0Q8Q2_DESAH|nr:rhodanese-like domain-containing protein [Desulforapulum autotrophicum]ACN14392.1 SseA [Desulforapulum autotrophicum HRM2]